MDRKSIRSSQVKKYTLEKFRNNLKATPLIQRHEEYFEPIVQLTNELKKFDITADVSAYIAKLKVVLKGLDDDGVRIAKDIILYIDNHPPCREVMFCLFQFKVIVKLFNSFPKKTESAGKLLAGGDAVMFDKFDSRKDNTPYEKRVYEEYRSSENLDYLKLPDDVLEQIKAYIGDDDGGAKMRYVVQLNYREKQEELDFLYGVDKCVICGLLRKKRRNKKN